jgi:hypothetical protein
MDPRAGIRGWTRPCSYEYQLQELFNRSLEVRQRVQTDLIDAYGSRLRLVQCPSYHRPWRGFVTLRADGVVAKEKITRSDPLIKARLAIIDLNRRVGEQTTHRPRSGSQTEPPSEQQRSDVTR